MKPLTPNRPHLIIMVGIPGAGKSKFAEHFAETFQAPIVSAHKLIDEDQIVYMLGELFKTGLTVILDGSSNTRHDREAYRNLARHAGYEPLLVWVQTEQVTAKARALRSGLDEDEFETATKKFAAPTATEKPAVISGKHTYPSQLKIVLSRLAGERPDSDVPSRRQIVLR